MQDNYVAEYEQSEMGWVEFYRGLNRHRVPSGANFLAAFSLLVVELFPAAGTVFAEDDFFCLVVFERKGTLPKSFIEMSSRKLESGCYS